MPLFKPKVVQFLMLTKCGRKGYWSCTDYDKLVQQPEGLKKYCDTIKGLSKGYRNCSFGLAESLPSLPT